MIRRLLALWPHPGLLVKLGALHIVLSVLQGLLFTLLIPILHALLADPVDFAAATPWLIAGAAGVLLHWILTVVATPVGFAASMRLSATLRRRLMAHATTLPLGWFDAVTKARLGRTVTAATGDLSRLIAQLGPQVIQATVVPLTLVTAIFVLDWRLGLLLLATTPVAVLVLRRSGRIAAEVNEELDEATTEVAGRALELGQAQPVLRAAGHGDTGGQRLRDSLEEHRLRYRSGLRRALLPGLGYAGVVLVAFVATLVLATALLLGGELSVPDTVALLVLAVRYLEPLGALSGLVGGLRAMENALGRVEAVLRTAPLPAASNPVRELAGTDIEFDGVRFSYGDAARALRSVSFRCPAGTTTALVGPSGSGKTTVTRLVARFADVTAGAVRIGGTDVRDLDNDTLMRSVAIVFQDVYLFDGTIEENVRLARPEATEAEFAEAARAARLDDVVARLPDGWRTRVGEGGAQLSGGERQRVSIARALIKQARIVLLDEVSSALDPENESMVQAAIADLCADPDRTVIVIAHRPGTLAGADHVVALEAGEVAERGTPAELLGTGGMFARIWTQNDRASGWHLTAGGRM